MQWSQECLCGNVLHNDNTIDVYGAVVELICNVACSGDAAETCGGGWRNNVYRHGATDRRENPIFGGGGFIGTMTLAACQAACAAPDTKNANGSPCVAVEWSSHSADPAATASCALAWGCTSTASWGGGGAYVMEQHYDLCDAVACNAAADCLSNQCTSNVCTSCFNSAQDSGETDVDCGGSICEKRCIVGEVCTAGDDCGTGKCDLTLTGAKASSAPPASTASRTPCSRRPTWIAAARCAASA
jgi:hypothetical protein